MYFLSIKVQLIVPNLVMRLDQHQRNQQLLAETRVTRVLPFSHSYISASDDQYYNRSSLYTGKTEITEFVTEYSHSAKSISKVRAGGRLSDAAFCFALLYLYMLKYHTVGFQRINSIPRPIHIESAHNLFFGRLKTDKFSFQNRVPTELDIGRSRMSRSIRQINMNEEYRKFLLVKHPKINCSPESFASLCTDAQRNKIIDASIKEAVIILKCEVRGIIQQVEKLNLDNGEPKLDFKINGSGNYYYVDVEEPRNYGRGNIDLDKARINMGHEIDRQNNHYVLFNYYCTLHSTELQ